METIKLNLKRFSSDLSIAKQNDEISYIKPNVSKNFKPGLFKPKFSSLGSEMTEEKKKLLKKVIENLDSIVIDGKTSEKINEIIKGKRTII